MRLRSGKVFFRGPNEDLISKLHDDLLIQILSLLPPNDVDVILNVCKRWNHLYTCLPNLCFVSPYEEPVEEVNEFHDLVDKILAIRRVQKIPIDKFYIDCNPGYNVTRVYDCLRTVVQCNVQQLVLRSPLDDVEVFRIGWDSIKSCNTLVELSLENMFLLDVPKGEVLFPSLKKLTLDWIHCDVGDKSYENLISGCPVLQQLVFKLSCNNNNNVSLCKLSISSASLKRLEICALTGSIHDDSAEAVIDTPNLEYMFIDGRYTTFTFSFTRPLSLVEAHIHTDEDEDEELYQILIGVSAAKILSLTIDTKFDNKDDEMVFNIPVFPNMIKFVVGFNDIEEWDLLFSLLNNMPNLEEIVFSEGYYLAREISWILPAEAPSCLRFKIQKIVILNKEVLKEEELTLVSYFLRHSSNLETLTLNAHNIDLERREQLLNCHRGSNVCQIELV